MKFPNFGPRGYKLEGGKVEGERYIILSETSWVGPWGRRGGCLQCTGPSVPEWKGSWRGRFAKLQGGGWVRGWSSQLSTPLLSPRAKFLSHLILFPFATPPDFCIPNTPTFYSRNKCSVFYLEAHLEGLGIFKLGGMVSVDEALFMA